jgi:PAS domain S-box-containing protein
MPRLEGDFLTGPVVRLAGWQLLALASLIACQRLSAAESEPRVAAPRLVVVLYPGANDGSPGAVLADEGIRQTFSQSANKVDVQNEFLDLSRFASSAQQQELAEFLERKYAGRKVDVVIAGLSSATKFALAHRARIFPGAPLVFMAVEREEIGALAPPPDVVGHPLQFELQASLELALALHPGTERVVVVVGRSEFDRYWEVEAGEAFQKQEKQVEIVFWSGQPLSQMLEAIPQLPPRTVVYYLHVFEDGDGKIHMPAQVLEQLAARSSAPIYSHVDSYVGRGIVGGRVFSFLAAGQQAAHLGNRILAGEDPAQIGIQSPSRNLTLFDWREVQRWGLSTSELPPESELRFRDPTIWDQYKWHLAGLLSLCGLQAILISGLLVQRSRRARAETRFRQAVDAAPTGMLMVSDSGEMVLVNAQLARMFDYPASELIGRTVELLLPVRYRNRHIDLRNNYFQEAAARSMGRGRELFGRRKDGSEFPVEVGLSPIRTEAGQFVLASIIDIGDRKATETRLRESREELRQLAAQMLGAQEAERRLIARELHDDLGQDLALLAVELDLYQQRVSAPSSEAAGRLETMSSRVKQLSSAVHDLSHQLHPMKLEQLGLEAAIRGFCHDLSRSHHLEIEFESCPLPVKPTAEAAICLYRIVQEALRNVVKHSCAARAQVHLSADGAELSLVVTDDGRGFDAEEVAGRGGLGLVSMRERLRLVEGELTIVSQPGSGTRIEARVPLRGEASAFAESTPSATRR